MKVVAPMCSERFALSLLYDQPDPFSEREFIERKDSAPLDKLGGEKRGASPSVRESSLKEKILNCWIK